MDPITFGTLLIGSTGSTLLLVTVLEKLNIPINEEMIKLVLETVKFGGILWFIHHISKIFF
ncbi:hypothetical protein [Niallia taxi]|uniref:hypothetical protein n=1 Tax=Niallia taxi TaxID=2499688 RepID=UPI00254B947F|nr:hypothetical protein [Niallia taxi]MDK8641346.1 hypothetical protein [Niallia taxi]